MSSWIEIWRILQVVLGIGLVIFVHEAGHFVAARLCKVRVDVFSLGFGPRLLGWRRGPTLYQVAAVPLGGFVKMAGDDPYAEEATPAPDSLAAKSVGQRFFIFSGGVLANVLFGLVVFPILFSAGIRFEEPVIGPPAPGSPAWQARLPENTRVLAVNGKEVYAFMHIINDVALGSGEECELRVLEPGAAEPRTLRLAPSYSERLGFSTIGVQPATDPEGRIEVLPGGPAERAGLASGDRLLGVQGGLGDRPLWEEVRRISTSGAPLRGLFERDGRQFEATIEPVPAARGTPRIGIIAPANHLVALRAGPRTAGLDLSPGDRILSCNGRPILREDDLARALLAAEGASELVIDRGGERRRVALPALERGAALALVDDLALEVDMESTRMVVSPGEPAAEAGLQDGDRVLAVDREPVQRYLDVADRARAAARADRALALHVEREAADGSGPRVLELRIQPRAWHAPDYGLEMRAATYVFRVDDPLTAVKVGMVSCWKFLQDTWLTLQSMVVNRVSPKNVGGPIAIGVHAHGWASAGWTKFFFFLCMLSINLAFINVLPIPLLDGGHLAFLVIEKLKGSPVSYRVMSYSQVVGLVLIVSLFVFVLYNDVRQHVLK